MPFKFEWLCELLEELQQSQYLRATAASRTRDPSQLILISWFDRYDNSIGRSGPSAIAFLSALFPERRVDRVYNLQDKRLSTIFGRALGLGHNRADELNSWRQRDGADFATCVEQVMAQCEFDSPEPGNEVTLEEIDQCLHQIAANSPFSSPNIRAVANAVPTNSLLTPILRRLQSHQAKWLIRLIRKSFGLVKIPERPAMRLFHFMLPDLLEIQNDFDACLKTLAGPNIRLLPARPKRDYELALRPLVLKELTPELGVMIRRQPYHKARSIKHCCSLANKQHMSVERKYDGEYCQIHVDLSRGHEPLRIFSKSGKNSTADRSRLHAAIRDCLRIGQNGCRIKRRCIVEGELLVWSTHKKTILPFHTIRKHVKHGGRFLGTSIDSPRKSDESLMIVVYDILLLDNEPLLHKSQTIRRQHLKAVVRTMEGRCILSERRIIDFASARAAKKLRESFAQAVTARWEGFVLKPCEEPYISWSTSNHGIKLKKDYIAGLGDTADLCIVGGRRDPHIEQELNEGPLRWTSFHVGCLLNKEAVRRFNAKPSIRIIDELTHHSMPKAEFLDLNTLGRLREIDTDNASAYLDWELGIHSMSPPSELFKEPFVAEIMGAGFEKLSDSSYFTLRFPRKVDGKVKIHNDRDLTATTGFDELQDLARRAFEAPEDSHSQEDARWIRSLLKAEGRSQSTQNMSQVTTPGKSPLSAETAILSPASLRQHSADSVFVRADTEELVDEDTQQSNTSRKSNLDDATTVTASTSQVTSRSDGSYRRGEKRAYEIVVGTKIETPRKRRRALGEKTPPCSSQSICSATPTTASRIVQLRSFEKHSAVAVSRSITTTRTSRSLDKPTRVQKTSATQNALDKLVESSAPGSNGHSLLWQTSSPLVNTIKSVSVCKRDTNTVRSASRPTDSPTFTDNSAGLPPLRLSLTDARYADFTKASISIQREADRSRRSVDDVCAHAKRNRMHSTQDLKIATPIYIPPSIYGRPSLQRRLQGWLQAIHHPYTLNLQTFLESLDTADNCISSSMHIIVLDLDDPTNGKADLQELFRELIFRHEPSRTVSSSSTVLCEPTLPSPHFRDAVTHTEVPTSSVEEKFTFQHDGEIMVWDWSMLDKIASSDNEEDRALDIVTLARFKENTQDHGRFGGLIKVHQKSWRKKRVRRFFLDSDWSWAGASNIR